MIFGILFCVLLLSCEKEQSQAESKITLLTNDSLKSWHLSKITDKNQYEFQLYPCATDDDYIFYKNGLLLVNNSGTIIAPADTLFSEPILCKNIPAKIDTFNWHFSSKLDSLIIKGKDTATHSEIIILTTDTLVIKKCYANSAEQIEYYTKD